MSNGVTILYTDRKDLVEEFFIAYSKNKGVWPIVDIVIWESGDLEFTMHASAFESSHLNNLISVLKDLGVRTNLDCITSKISFSAPLDKLLLGLRMHYWSNRTNIRWAVKKGKDFTTFP